MKPKNLNCFFKLIFTVLILSPGISYSQGVSLTPSNYTSYGVSCLGASDGEISVLVVGLIPPYLFSWNNGSTAKDQTNLVAGTYTITVTDASFTSVSETIELTEPKPLETALDPFVYEGGYNISKMGGSDGRIYSSILGGVPPYTYLWSNGSKENKIQDLDVGIYTLTVTDMNNCTATASVTLTEPTALQIVSITSTMYNGYNIPCFKQKGGDINLTVTGGAGSYKYQWNNGEFTEDLTDLVPGTYMVVVTDEAEARVMGQIVLTEPTPLDVQFTLSTYPNDKNVSCYGCSNGSITTAVSGGATPYSYLWEGGATTANLSNKGAGLYPLIVTDANGCQVEISVELTGPDRDDWTMTGNAGTNPPYHFFGTTDNKDMVFKTNNVERLRIKESGGINSMKMIGQDYDVVMVGPNGDLLRVDPDGNQISNPEGAVEPDPVISCFPWSTCGNSVRSYNYLGTRNNMDLIVKTNAVERMRITKTGIVGIGIDPNTQNLPSLNNYKLLVGGTMGAKEIWVSLGQPAWPDYVFSEDYKLTSLEDIKKFIKKNKHLPEMPSAEEIGNDGAINLGLIQTNSVKEIEQLYLQLFKLNDRITELEKQNIALQKMATGTK